MTQQIIIIADTAVALKPLVESAIRTELRMLALGLERTHRRLIAFEERYKMTSEDFEQSFSRGDIAESLDYTEWWGEINTYHLLKTQQHALESARLN